MKANSASIIKTMRKEMGLSQEEMAEQLFISVRQLARMESGEVGMDVWQFITTLELLGAPSEDFWLLYLDSGEYASYRDYRRLRRRLNYDNLSGAKAKDIIADMENSPLIKQPAVKQYVSHAKTYGDTDMPITEKMDRLLEAMYMSKPHFDEDKISEYRMTYNEISIALCIAECYEALGEYDRAISMLQSMISSRERAKVSEEDNELIFSSIYFVLACILRSAGRYKDAVRACDKAIEICREYNNHRNIPAMLFCMADCYYMLGEEELIYKTLLVRGYYTAYAIGRNDIAKAIKTDALNNYGLVVP